MKREVLHHRGIWVYERVCVASAMQHTMELGRHSEVRERCCITMASGTKWLASECALHQCCNTMELGCSELGEMLHPSPWPAEQKD